ncbi:hypothetical protein BC936DRAFT_149917 [Jimgerdemannia flammicorona]|uniref:G-protein coupled receptors family 2 profile 2 domain-containing protein n=1 Tax=Jimgerdemannia flammicorona TaxID=994334 RepID=A0A433CZW0_9FUNG|nr:hypothetical protein BC936DRAFT_149917 [Jimgerdemannia flammicorona]
MSCISWDSIEESTKQNIWTAQRIFSSISIVSITTVFGYVFRRRFICKRKFTNPAERLVLLNLVPVFIGTIGMLISNDPWGDDPNNVNMPYCQFQTVLIEFRDMGCVLMAALFAWNLYTIIHTFRRPSATSHFTVNDLLRHLERRERFYIVIAYFGGVVFAVVSIPLAAPRNQWCWVKNAEIGGPLGNSLYALLFFFAWMWIVLVFSIAVLLYVWYDRLQHRRDYKTMKDIRSGSIAAFSWILIIDVMVWVCASTNRFWSFAKECDNLQLIILQAAFSCGRGMLLATAYFLLKVKGQFIELEPMPEMVDAPYSTS